MVGIPRRPSLVREENYVKIYTQFSPDLTFHELTELSAVIDDFLHEKEVEQERRRRFERATRIEEFGLEGYTYHLPTPKKKIMTKIDDHDPWKINIWCDSKYDKKIKEVPGIYRVLDCRLILGYLEGYVDVRYDIAEVQNYIESLAK